MISDESVRIAKSAHPYVGDAPANINTLIALGVPKTFGEFTIELQTGEEPYGIKVVLKSPLSAKRKAYYESRMMLYSFEAIAVIDNLSYVSFEYAMDGQKRELSWSREDASNMLGRDLKSYGAEAQNLEELKLDVIEIQQEKQ